MSHRLSNGRSPLIRKQSQITAFFSNPTPKSTSTPSPSPSESAKQKNKPPLSIPPSQTPSPPTKPKTPPSSEAKPHKVDVIGKRVKVYWPLDKAWYTGEVKSYDKSSNKHLIQYEDGESEAVELEKEKIEWVEEEPVKKLRRLRKLSDSVEAESKNENEFDCMDDDDSSDEDWGKNAQKEESNGDSESEGVELDEEEEEEEVVTKSRKRRSVSSSQTTGKKKKLDVSKMGISKKFNFDGAGEKNLLKKKENLDVSKSSPVLKTSINQSSNKVIINDTNLSGEAAERFGKREYEKFKFLGEGRKDAKGRKCGDPNYDPRTLYLPPDFVKGLSGGQRQWWEFKAQHMDKVLFFKMGKFYELFEMDAHIGAKELDLQYMKGEQPHCGFPEKNLTLHVDNLARKGYRVLVVEQTETPDQLEIRRKEMGSKDKVVKREICAVVSKGTLIEGESLITNPDASYIMSITENYTQNNNNEKDNNDNNTIIGVCLLDVSTSKFIIGQFEDDSDRHLLCSILSELRPVEIIKPSKTLSSQTEKSLKSHLRDPLINTLTPQIEFWDSNKTVKELTNYYGSDEGESAKLPQALTELVNAGAKGSFAISALGGCLFYLKQAFLDEKLIKCGDFESLPCGARFGDVQKYMVLDSAALENLELLENIRTGGSDGTLFAQLDHCVTPFGKRLLKRWIARPLYDRKLILQRQDAIAAFKGEGLSYALEFRKEISRLPDLERLLSRLFGSSQTNNERKAILYEDASKKKLLEFTSVLRGCQLIIQSVSSLSPILSSSDSTLLLHLLTPGKGMPDLGEFFDYFKEAFDWSEAENSGRIIPHEGCDVDYDSACYVIKNIESEFSKYLKEQRKLLGDSSINYVNVGKDTYLLEVPERLRESIPRNYELQSSKKGYFRYWTPKIKEMLAELSEANEERENKLKGILQRLIIQFSEHHTKWRQLVSITAELDVLMSLAIAGDYYEGPTCRPIIKPISSNPQTAPTFLATSLGHPLLKSESLNKGSFVPNDVTIGGPSSASCLLLTGPNMGGKSTLLRQVCMAAVLAQMGADVPAERLEMELVDRVYVRMGATDRIMAAQSTFLVELTETASMLAGASRNSLVALDELGRGTSTSDGQAIAAAVLEYLVSRVKCRGLFSTHYHRLAVDYEKNNKIALCHMACQVGKGEDGLEQVTFLYRLTAGSCPKSYGVNVARLAGIPASVLQKAAEKSSEFELTYGKKGKKFVVGIVEETIAVVKGLLKERDSMDVEFLRETQQKAKLLISGI
ncbi:hypothetical protein LUZ60_003133 [Juncus effusus]|nr:hypothetical protein LUZ60_003133 [Juncus effusus]